MHWINLEELSQQPNLDPLLNLPTLPKPIQRFLQLSEEQITVIAGIPREKIRHSSAVQDYIGEGRKEGR